jgi:uncharacterized protein YjiS (DUF1127 family)
MFDFEPIQLRDNFELIKHCTEDCESKPRPREGAAAVEQRLRRRRRFAGGKPMGQREMTTIPSIAARRSASGAWRGFVRSIENWIDRLAAYWARRATVKTLHELDDHALRDIGLARDQIESAVNGIGRRR